MLKYTYSISGMHCAACEVLVERKLRQAPGVVKVKVNHANGRAKIYCSQEPELSALRLSIKDEGYDISYAEAGRSADPTSAKNQAKDYLEIGAIFLLLLAVYLLLKQFKIIPDNLGIGENLSYGLVFVLGLVAAVSSCLAVTGGLLLAVSARYNEAHPTLGGWQKFKPHLYFNFGRLLGYLVFGGLIGALGSALTLSLKVNGLITIAASLAMIFLAFNLLRIFPKLKIFHPRLPKFLAHKIHDLSGKEGKLVSFSLGALTFFLPCGFTQALQLYVLASGNMVSGALIMFVFALGTLPALLSVGLLSSLSQGRFKGYVIKLAGILVLVIGLVNISRGFNLAGWPINLAKESQATTQSNPVNGLDPNVALAGGKQIVKMRVIGLDYYPARFKVAAGVPVEWQIDGRQAAGCAQAMVAPVLGVSQYLSKSGISKIAFTPTKPGKIYFSCPMGMTTPGAAFTVLEQK